MGDESPWRSSSQRFPIDILLRRRGFQIQHRPKYGPVVWSRGGKQFTQTQATEIAKHEAISEDAKRKEAAK